MINLNRVHGVVPPVLTPMTAEGGLDGDGLDALIEFLLNAGVHGLFMMGSTGESYVLPDAVREETVARAAATLKGRVPLYVGIGDNSLERTLRNSEHAATTGADVLVALSPPYLNYAASEQERYFREVADRVSLPVLLYNIPQVVKNPLTAPVLERLASHPNIIGIKDSESNAPKSAMMRTMLERHPDFRWFEGNDFLAAQSLAMGAHGIVNGGANLFPRVYLSIYEAARSGDVEALRAAHHELMRCWAVFEVDLPHSTSFGAFVKGAKYGLRVLGICSDHVSFPFEPLSRESKREIERLLRELGE